MRLIVLIYLFSTFNLFSQSDFGPPYDPTYGMVQPNIPTNTGNVINQSDVSQLAKSGDIDITEAIAARRT